MQFFVYALESINTGKVYIGQTVDLERRLDQHNKKQVRSTAKHAPWKIIKFREYPTRDAARWQEYLLKKSLGRRQRWLKSSNE